MPEIQARREYHFPSTNPLRARERIVKMSASVGDFASANQHAAHQDFGAQQDVPILRRGTVSERKGFLDGAHRFIDLAERVVRAAQL
jgi:hypothetical protein